MEQTPKCLNKLSFPCNISFPQTNMRGDVQPSPHFLPPQASRLSHYCGLLVSCTSVFHCPSRMPESLLICLQVIVLAVLNKTHIKQVELIKSLPTQLMATGSDPFSLFPDRGENKAHTKAKHTSFPLSPFPSPQSRFLQQQNRSLSQSAARESLNLSESTFPRLTKFKKE